MGESEKKTLKKEEKGKEKMVEGKEKVLNHDPLKANRSYTTG